MFGLLMQGIDLPYLETNLQLAERSSRPISLPHLIVPISVASLMPLVSPSWHGLDVTDVTLILLHPPYFGSSFTLSKPQRFQDSVCVGVQR